MDISDFIMGSSHLWPSNSEPKLHSQRSSSCPHTLWSSSYHRRNRIDTSSSTPGPSRFSWSGNVQSTKRKSADREDEDEDEEEKQSSLRKRSKTDDTPKKRKSKSKNALWKKVWLKKTDKSSYSPSDVDERESGSEEGRYDKETTSAPKCSKNYSSPQPGPSGVSTCTKKRSACDEEEEEELSSLRKKSKTDDTPKKKKSKHAIWKKVWLKKTDSSPDRPSNEAKRESGSDEALENKYVHTSSEISWLLEEQKKQEKQQKGVILDTIQEMITKYTGLGILQEGGFGKVYYGVRNEDNVPVAIKVIKKENVTYTTVEFNEHSVRLPEEVYFLVRVGAGPNSSDSRVAPQLLDWYEVNDEIILVQERPEPCKDLQEYIDDNNGVSPDVAKIIFRQLVDEAIHLESKGIFHRDIKPDNVLVETGSDFLRARFIDFGYSTLFTPGQKFYCSQGNPFFSSPEWFYEAKYTAGPTTVWQLSLCLYAMLLDRLPREIITDEFITSNKDISIPSSLSPECQDLLRSCLEKDPKKRLSLQGIRDHPWLNPE